jgi:hypothetical protein
MPGRPLSRASVRVAAFPPGEVHDARRRPAHPGRWPSAARTALPEPAWVDAHASEFDVAHVHVGLVDMSPVAFFGLAVRLRAHGKPLVVTVHNLEHACLAPGALDELLRAAVPAADEVVTFTVGAGREILRRWGRTAHILPHPAVLPTTRAARRPRVGAAVVGMDLTAACDLSPGWAAAEAVAAALSGLRGARLRVDVYPQVLRDPATAAPAARLGATGVVDVHARRPLHPRDLAAYLEGLDAFVVPAVRCTHSSWLEACHEAGTTPLVPDLGCLAEQRPNLPYHPADAQDLARAVHAAVRSRGRLRSAPPAEQAAERAFAELAHHQLYLALAAPADASSDADTA